MSHKILIVDDEDDIVLYLTVFLKNNGYDVVSTTDPLKAYALAQKERPDLICLDIMMPRKSGVSLYTSFKSDESLGGIPVAIISGIGSAYGGAKPDFKKLLPETIDEPEAFFEKPLDVNRFLKFLGVVFNPGAGDDR